MALQISAPVYELLPSPKNPLTGLKFYNLVKDGQPFDITFSGDLNPNLLVWSDKLTGRTTVHVLINVDPSVTDGLEPFQSMLSGIQPDVSKHRHLVRPNGDIKIKMNSVGNVWAFDTNMPNFNPDMPVVGGAYEVKARFGAYTDDKGMCGLFLAMKALNKV